MVIISLYVKRVFFLKKSFKRVQTIAFDRRLHNASVPLDLHIDHTMCVYERLHGCIPTTRTHLLGAWSKDTNRLTALRSFRINFAIESALYGLMLGKILSIQCGTMLKKGIEETWDVLPYVLLVSRQREHEQHNLEFPYVNKQKNKNGEKTQIARSSIHLFSTFDAVKLK